jgi:hypothetical protein
MWINLDELLGLPKVTVVNYREIDGALFLKLKMKNEVMECPNCHKELEDINQIEYNLVRDLSELVSSDQSWKKLWCKALRK